MLNVKGNDLCLPQTNLYCRILSMDLMHYKVPCEAVKIFAAAEHFTSAEIC